MENFLDVALAAYEDGSKEKPMIDLAALEAGEKRYKKWASLFAPSVYGRQSMIVHDAC